MGKHDSDRREFLVRAVVGAGAVAGAGLVPGAYAEPAAQNTEQHSQAAPSAQMHSNAIEHGAFFNHEDSATIVAFTERLMPGARDSGVLNYIDLALSGAYAELQYFYRQGLAQLHAYSVKTYKAPFVRLDAVKQDEVIAALESGKATEFTWPTAQDFFNTVRTHTMEGMFADPVYGGNKDFAGWRLVGFPGAQAIFTPADLESRQPFTRAPLIGLQVQAKGPSRVG